MKILATTFYGFEEILSKEIESIGGKEIQLENRAVSFEGNKAMLYNANLHLRTALRVLVPVATFQARSEHTLYQRIKSMNWRQYLQERDTFAIEGTVNSEHFRHTKYPILKMKDAIADYFREVGGKRPSVDLESPTIRFHLHINERVCTISLDSSGRSLHKRGYRTEATEAPLNEGLAAGMILLTGYDGSVSFADIFCGSGTILIEAAMIATNTAPGLLDPRFGFMKWKDFDSQLWMRLLREARKQVRNAPAEIAGCDIDKHAFNTALRNALRAGFKDLIRIEKTHFDKFKAPAAPGILVSNPPYGERLDDDKLIELYAAAGDKLKQDFKGYSAWLLSSNKDALKRVGLRTSRRMQLYNGPLVCKYHGFALYEGSKKAKKQE